MSETISNYVLCQDCLRILPYTPELHQEEGSCLCGGDMCGCDGCNESAHLLLRGERDQYVLGLLMPITHWSPVTGIGMQGAEA